ncbi:uncharacterized protein TRIADDRAFT_61487 [Trichoplax adhaerens]|uniref:APAF-1 helical domain-containing protein n=1 Tax=Trichoplax adhaerens TaxID=10228 RepID=B3SB46_TRIAD|nr:hypothetical protein TRIADDRAFT_61487 [Trichoplax adhaerens]EDV20044.1 hypothetical protein TRIADDRAFT_61487 [Trichoplax adhaerens]|eukprot:XP_002117428.1 hypothetical protein TRIADDRAFT_61487 [Trichoplax adhaerens]
MTENQPIRPFVVLDDVREANQLLYLNFNCDTIVTTRNADIASKLNREKCVIHIKELLTVEHCRNVMASTAKIPISTLPKAVDQFIEIVDHSALILTLFGILVQHDKDKWNISDNKWLNQYQSQYDTKTMLHKLIDMLLSNLNESDLNLILKLDIFEENTIIPINTLSMYWGVNQHYCISIMNSLVHRFLATENVVNTKNIGYSLNDYMADYIRSRHCVSDAKANHVTLLDLYKKSCQGDWVQLRNDDYIHDHLVDHVIGADDKKTMKELLTNFKWLQIRLKNKSSYALLHDFIKSRSILDFEEWNHLHDYWYLVRDSHSSINLCQDGSLIQLALSRPWWRDFYKEVESKAIEDCKETTFFKWNNCYNQRNEFQICIATLEPTSESITSSCFSSDGTMLACCDKIGNIIIYDTILWTPLYSFHSTKGKISNCSFSPDCQKIALSFHCGKTEVWNINNEKILIEHGYHTAKVNWSEFSPSGQEVVSCSDDRLIMIWNSNTGNNIVTCRGHKNMVIDCHYSKDGGRILSCSWDKTIQIWDTTFGTSLLVCAITEDWPIFCSFLDHDQHIMCGCEHRVYIWDSSTGDAIDKLTSTCRDRVSLYDVTANGKMAVRCLFGSNLVEVIDTSSGQTSIVTDDGHHDLITCAKISPNSKIIATTSKDTLLKLWLVQPFKENMEKADKKPMHLLDCSFIGNVPHIISGEYEQWEGQAIEVLFWDTFVFDCGKDVRFVKETCKEDWKCVKCCSLSHNGNLLAVGFAFGKVKMLHHDNLEVDWSINNLQLHVNNLTFNSTDEVLMIVNSINGDIVNKFISEDQICFYKFLESSNILLIGAARGEMQAYNIYENSKSIDSLSIPGKIIHHDLALDDAECAVILEDKDSKACIVWNCVSFKITHTVDSNTCISTCKFSTKCDKLAIGYDYGTFKIWETTSWTLLTSFDGHLGSIQTLYFSADDKIILTGGNQERNNAGDYISNHFSHKGLL